MAKSGTRFVCQNCGASSPKWQGRCSECNEWNTMTEEAVRAAPTRLASAIARGENNHPSSIALPGIAAGAPRPITLVAAIENARTSTGNSEFDRVLGGGIVPGSLVLIGGDPGVGKSTLLTGMAGYVAKTHGQILYVSGEESAEQIKLRATRMGADHENLLVASETDVAQIAMYVQTLKPRFLIIDSIQTMQSPDAESAPGTVSQVRASGAAFAALAKGTQIPTFLVGHVTKEGTIAGPRVLEHMVDTVLYFEGDRHLTYRMLRAVKNRFGSTDELGLFAMREEGLVGVENPSEIFLAERPANSPGSTVTATIEGSRPLLVEVQALVAPSALANPRRMTNGIDRDRVALVLAVLEKRVGLSLSSQDVFVNVAGGVEITEPAADLAVALAVASSLMDIAVDPNAVFLGEVGLSGEVRSCTQIEKRLREASRLGFSSALVARRNAGKETRNIGIQITGADSLREAVQQAILSRK